MTEQRVYPREKVRAECKPPHPRSRMERQEPVQRDQRDVAEEAR